MDLTTYQNEKRPKKRRTLKLRLPVAAMWRFVGMYLLRNTADSTAGGKTTSVGTYIDGGKSARQPRQVTVLSR